jgi:hypothetical protein
MNFRFCHREYHDQLVGGKKKGERERQQTVNFGDWWSSNKVHNIFH